MAPLLVEVKAPFVVFIFYFDLIFRQFNFHNMHEWLNSFHLSEEKNFHNKNLKQEWPFACRPRISHLLYFLLLWLAQLALFWALIQGWIFSSFAVCYQWWPSNLSELQKGFNERARYTLSAWRQSVLVCKASALQIDIRGSPKGEISYVQEFSRIILAWKPMQTFFLGSALNLSCGSKEVLICLSYPTLVHLLHFCWPPIMQEVSVHWAHLSPHWATEPFCTTQQ